MKKSIFRATAAATIAVAGLALCHYAHASNFTITSSTSGSSARFIVTRDDTTAAETVNYRTVSLSAYAGQHYTAKSGTLTFPAGQSAVTNTVTETSPTVDAYNFQAEAWREYSFVLTDEGGFPLAIGYRNFITGTKVKSDDAFGEKRVSINAGRITVKDGGYDQAYYDVPIDSYYSAAAPKKYLVATGAQLRMTLNFLAREKDDGYQYVAIYANTSTSNVDTGAKDGDPGNVSSSRYMAGFTIDGNVSSTYYPYVFPLTSKDTACGEQVHPWSNNSNGNLKQQYFKTNCRATDGRRPGTHRRNRHVHLGQREGRFGRQSLVRRQRGEFRLPRLRKAQGLVLATAQRGRSEKWLPLPRQASRPVRSSANPQKS